MSAITIRAFNGLKPIIDPHLLDTGDAVIANNVRLVSGALRPLRGTTTLKALTKVTPATIWRYGNSATETNWWLEFLIDTDVIHSPITDDTWGRVYWADGVKPKYGPNSAVISGASYPGAGYDLGLPAPASPVTASGTAPEVASDGETRGYLATYVSAYGEEGPPSAASTLVTIDPAEDVGLTDIPGAPSGAYNIATKRIYRSSTVGSAAQWQFVDEIPVAQTTYTDSKSQAELGEVLTTEGHIAPPDGLRGLKLLACAAAIGFVDNTVHLSEPNLPHAWPHRYPLDGVVVGIGVFRQGAAILTNGHPYLLIGNDPGAMSPERLEKPQACLSKASIVDTGDGCLYASPDGVVSIGSGGMDVVSKGLLSKDEWQAYNPASMRAWVYDGKYIVAYEKTDESRGILIFDFGGQGAALTTCDINAETTITAGYADARTDTLYFALGTDIVRFDSGDPLMLTHRGKVFRTAPKNFKVAAVDASSYPLTLRLYADGALKYTRVVTSKRAFKLPSGFRASTWQFQFTSTGAVERFRIATSTQELQANA